MKKILAVMILIAVMLSSLVCANAEDWDYHGHKIHTGIAFITSDYAGCSIATIDNRYQIMAATPNVWTEEYVIVAFDNWNEIGRWIAISEEDFNYAFEDFSMMVFGEIYDDEEWW